MELKATTIYDAYWKATCNGDNSVPVYIKSEADNVIAEKDKEIARLDDLAHAHNIELLLKENVIADKDKELRNQKYKRCLAMAKLSVEDDYAPWNMKWHKRWLEIAEIFKEAK